MMTGEGMLSMHVLASRMAAVSVDSGCRICRRRAVSAPIVSTHPDFTHREWGNRARESMQVLQKRPPHAAQCNRFSKTPNFLPHSMQVLDKLCGTSTA